MTWVLKGLGKAFGFAIKHPFITTGGLAYADHKTTGGKGSALVWDAAKNKGGETFTSAAGKAKNKALESMGVDPTLLEQVSGLTEKTKDTKVGQIFFDNLTPIISATVGLGLTKKGGLLNRIVKLAIAGFLATMLYNAFTKASNNTAPYVLTAQSDFTSKSGNNRAPLNGSNGLLGQGTWQEAATGTIAEPLNKPVRIAGATHSITGRPDAASTLELTGKQ